MFVVDWMLLAHISHEYGSFPARNPEPEFLNILKCNLAESASAGFQFNWYDLCNDKTHNYSHFDHFLGLLKFTEKSLSIIKQKL